MAEPVVRDPEVPLEAPVAPRAGRRTRAAAEAPAPAAETAAEAPVQPARRPRTAPAAPDLQELRIQLLVALRQHHPQADLAVVERAFDLAVRAHETQVRASGEPYVTHPIASAQI